MTKSKNTKRALLASVLSMMLCMAMLIGSTFAWFTDTVTSGVNKIVAGNLDIELDYATAFNEDGSVKTWTPVTAATELFKEFEEDGETKNLWEPGHTEYVCLRVHNAGSLALKYQFDVNVYGDKDGKTAEKTYKNIDGGDFQLSKSLVFSQIDGAKKVNSREDLWLKDSAAEKDAMGKLDRVGLESDKMLPSEEKIVTLAVYMPTQVGNEANYKTDTTPPEIYLGLSVVATQAVSEPDSFGNDYDSSAPLIKDGYAAAATADEVNAALMAGKNIVLTDNVEISSQTPGISADTVTIDLNGKTLTAKGILALKKEVRTYMTQEDYDQLVAEKGLEYVEGVYGKAENCVGKYLLKIEYLPVEAKIENGTYIVKNNGAGRVRFETGSSCVFENVTFKSDTGKFQQAIQVYVNKETAENTYVFRGCTFENTYVGFDTSSGVPVNYDISFEKCSFNIEKPENSSAAIKFERHTIGKLSVSDCSFNIKADKALKSFAIYHQGANGDNQGTLVDVTLNNVTFIGEKINSPYAGYYYISMCVGEGNTGVLSITETGTNSYKLNYESETITTDCWGN